MSNFTAFPADGLRLARTGQDATPEIGSGTSAASARGVVEPWLVVWAVAVPLGLLDGLHWYLQSPPVNPAVVVLHVLVAWSLYPVLVPFARFVTLRFPLDIAGWHRYVPIHIVAALTFQYVHLQINHFLLVMVVRPLFFQNGSARRAGRRHHASHESRLPRPRPPPLTPPGSTSKAGQRPLPTASHAADRSHAFACRIPSFYLALVVWLLFCDTQTG